MMQLSANTSANVTTVYEDAPRHDQHAAPRPLVVDVEGTLIRTDLFHEAALQFVGRRPLQSWRLLAWLTRGRAHLKQRLGECVEIDVLTMPMHEETVALVRHAQQDGRPIYLASAAPRALVQPLAVRLGGVAGIFCSDAQINFSGSAKAECLVARFGTGGFDYVGNSQSDMPVWRAAAQAFAVAATSGVERKIHSDLGQTAIIARPRTALVNYVQTLRPHQWSKNLLLFVPAVTSHSTAAASLLMACLACMMFCLAASSAYLFNDLFDLQADRAHPRKCARPLASGLVPVWHGVLMAVFLLVAALGLAASLSTDLLRIIGLYVAATLAYSFVLKRQLIVDVIALAGLYTLRVFAGAAAIGTQISPWLLMFSLFLFLSLALIKRCSELALSRDRDVSEIPGRGYRTADLPVINALAAAAGFGAVLIFTLYLSSPEVALLYTRPDRLWFITPVLLAWVGRTIIVSNRGEIHDDPVIFALTDRFSIGCGLCTMALVFCAI